MAEYIPNDKPLSGGPSQLVLYYECFEILDILLGTPAHCSSVNKLPDVHLPKSLASQQNPKEDERAVSAIYRPFIKLACSYKRTFLLILLARAAAAAAAAG